MGVKSRRRGEAREGRVRSPRPQNRHRRSMRRRRRPHPRRRTRLALGTISSCTLGTSHRPAHRGTPAGTGSGGCTMRLPCGREVVSLPLLTPVLLRSLSLCFSNLRHPPGNPPAIPASVCGAVRAGRGGSLGARRRPAQPRHALCAGQGCANYAPNHRVSVSLRCLV